MEDKFNAMENKVDKIEQKVDNMDAKLEQIYERLIGSVLFPDGIIKELKILQEEVALLKKFKMKIIYTIGGIMAIGGFIGYICNIIYNWLAKK